MSAYRFLADVIVVVHAAYIAFVVFGMAAILLGVTLRWRWTRNFWFRAAHFLAIAIVVVQALLGIVCPLTVLEGILRERAGQEGYPGSFIAYWAHELIFYRGTPAVFTTCYCLFGAAVLAMLFLAPPRWPWRQPSNKPEPPNKSGVY